MADLALSKPAVDPVKKVVTNIDELTQQKNHSQAWQQLEQALRAWPENKDLLLRKARLHYFLRQPQEAYQLYRELLVKNTAISVTDAEFFGQLALSNNNLKEAEQVYQNIKRQVPKRDIAEQGFFRISLQQQDYPKALQLLLQLSNNEQFNLSVFIHIINHFTKVNQPQWKKLFIGYFIASFPGWEPAWEQLIEHTYKTTRQDIDNLLAGYRKIFPDSTSIDKLEGHYSIKRNRFRKAISLLQQAIKASPNNYMLAWELISVHLRYRKAKPALELFEQHRQVLQQKIGPQQFTQKYVEALRGAGKTEQALKVAEQFYQTAPHKVVNIDFYAGLLALLRKYDLAIDFLREQIANYAVPPKVLANRLVSLLMAACRYSEALIEIKQFLQRYPDDIMINMQGAFAALNEEQFDLGWKYYERRLLLQNNKKFFIKHTGERWQGQDLTGKRLLVVAEQGIGDTIMVARYLAALQQKCANLILQVQRPLVKILRHNYPKIQIYQRGTALPQYDYYMQMMSLFAYFQTTKANVPGRAGYLRWDGDHLTRTTPVMQFDRRKRLVVAIGWQGEANHPNDINRSFDVELLAKLVKPLANRVEFVSLQRDYQDELDQFAWGQNVVRMGDKLHDITDTAELLQKVDLLICCDSAPIHLAGALGCPAWVLVNSPCEWRWQADGEDNYWYNSLKIKRVTRQDYQWSTLFAKIHRDLLELLDSSGASASKS